MKAAPPVSVRAAGGAWWRLVLISLPALSAGALAAWLATWAQADGPATALAAAAAALGAAMLAWRVERPREIELSWDGQRWSADGVSGRIEPRIDLGAWMLLELTPERRAPAIWLALSGVEAGAAATVLRAAVYSSRAGAAPSDKPDSGQPGSPPA